MSGSEPECVLACACELGEGPVWHDDALWFVDIKGRRIHRYEPGGAATSWSAPDQPGFIAPLVDGGWIAGLKSGLHRFDPATGGFELIVTVEDPALDNRLNDGAVDARGRLWFGSMHDGERNSSGALYRLESGRPVRLDEGYVITNGPCFSPDGATLYHTDTLRKVIYAFDVADDGGICNRRPFVTIDEPDVYPDGSVVDAEGCLWTALWGGWGVRRYSPRGEIIGFVRLPVAQVTKVAFGGADLRTVYVTSAWKGLSTSARRAQPLAGDVFRFAAEVAGLQSPPTTHL